MAYHVDCLIWTQGGVWLQSRAEDGTVKASYCGRQLTYDQVRQFAFDRGIPFFEQRYPASRQSRAVVGSSHPVAK